MACISICSRERVCSFSELLSLSYSETCFWLWTLTLSEDEEDISFESFATIASSSITYYERMKKHVVIVISMFLYILFYVLKSNMQNSYMPTIRLAFYGFKFNGLFFCWFTSFLHSINVFDIGSYVFNCNTAFLTFAGIIISI